MGRDRIGRSTTARTAARLAAAACVLVSAAFVAAGCGGSADSANAAGTPTLGFMTWADPTGLYDRIVDRCNTAANGRWKVVSTAMGPSTDAGREQLTRRLAAKDHTIDIMNLDVIWTAEFSDAGWLVDLTDRVKPLEAGYLSVALDSTKYKGKTWAVPVGTNASLLYYRTDLVKTPPKTWEELAEQVKAIRAAHPELAGFVFQGAPYEGGSVDAAEFIYSAGAEVVSKDGKAMVGKGDGALHAMKWLHQAMQDKVAPAGVRTYQEEETRMAFQSGGAIFMRNWPYAWPLMSVNTSKSPSKVVGKFDVAPLPSFEGHDAVSVVGGQNYGISAFSEHPDLAWEAITCLGNEQAQREKAIQRGEFPTLTKLYTDPEIVKEIPYIGQSLKAFQSGRNRPATPYYNDVTSVLYKAYNEVLAGGLTPEAAVKRMQRGIELALDGKAEI